MGNSRSKTLHLGQNKNDNRPNAGRYTVVKSLSEAQYGRTSTPAHDAPNLRTKEDTESSREFHNIQSLPCYVPSHEEHGRWGTGMQAEPEVRPDVARFARHFIGPDNTAKVPAGKGVQMCML